MTDRKNVIKGLERCLICDTSVVATEEAQNAYRECEYTVGLYCGQKKLLRDALVLLKEQNQRIWDLLTENERLSELLKEQESTINELQNAYGYLQKQFFEVQDKLLKEQEAVEPVKTCASKSELGVDGLLIVGNCPVCGQTINNSDNKFCGGCGRPIYWTRITNKCGLWKGR